MSKGVRSEAERANDVAYGRKRLADARKAGIVYVGVFLQPEVAAFIDQVKKARGFHKRDEVINCLFRDYLMTEHAHLAHSGPGLPGYETHQGERKEDHDQSA